MSEQQRQTASEAARVEAARQSVEFAFMLATLGATLAAIAVQRSMSDADFSKALRMALWQRLERGCARAGFRALRAAERCRLAYDRARL